ncbi:MAG: sigma-70 family RNA polymerase sigma factor [Planctomycetota bacterium]
MSLLAEHEAQIFGFLCALVCHREDSEDLMQQVVVTMWQKFDEFQPGTNFAAWGCQIAKNRALNYFQTRSRRRVFSTPIVELLEDAAARQPAPARQARRRALTACLEKLTQSDRELILASYGAGKARVKSLAESLGRPAGSVSNSLRRIRQALYRCIESTLAQEERA